MRLITAKTCASLLDISLNTWYDWVKHDPTAPKPALQISEGRRFSRWLYHEVQKYIVLLVKEQRTGWIPEAHEKGGRT